MSKEKRLPKLLEIYSFALKTTYLGYENVPLWTMTINKNFSIILVKNSISFHKKNIFGKKWLDLVKLYYHVVV